MTQEPMFLTVTQVSEMLNLDPSSVRRMVHDGILDGFRPSVRKILISSASVNALIAQTRIVPVKPAKGKGTE